MDTQDIPGSAIRAVSKKLRHYIDVQRREEGFDNSSPTNLMGNFSSTKGTAGTFHYNSLQDRHLKHYYQQPLVRRQLVEAGVIHPGMLRDVRRRERSRSAGQQQRHSAKMESDVLLTTAARLLLSSSYFSPGGREKSSSRRTQSVRAPSSRPSHTQTHSTQSVIETPEPSSTSLPRSNHSPTPSPPRCVTPVVRCSVGVGTLHTSEACTQTAVDVSTQTHLSKVLENASKSKRRSQKGRQKLKTRNTSLDCDS